MSQAAIGFERSETMISTEDQTQGLWEHLQSRRTWRNAAVAIVAVAAAANVGILVITAGF